MTPYDSEAWDQLPGRWLGSASRTPQGRRPAVGQFLVDGGDFSLNHGLDRTLVLQHPI